MSAFCTVGGGSTAFRGCLAKLAADQTGVNATANYTIPFDGADEYDTDGIHDPVTNNTRLTVPSGVSKVRIYGSVQVSNHTSATNVIIIIRVLKNGSLDYIGCPVHVCPGSTGGPLGSFASQALPVSPGDYFEMQFFVSSDTAVDIQSERTSFGMEIVE